MPCARCIQSSGFWLGLGIRGGGGGGHGFDGGFDGCIFFGGLLLLRCLFWFLWLRGAGSVCGRVFLRLLLCGDI